MVPFPKCYGPPLSINKLTLNEPAIRNQPISVLPHYNPIHFICKDVKQGIQLACLPVTWVSSEICGWLFILDENGSLVLIAKT